MFAVSATRTNQGVRAIQAKIKAEELKRDLLLCRERIKRAPISCSLTFNFTSFVVRQVGDRGFGKVARITTEDRSRLLIRSVAHEYGVTYHDLLGCGRSTRYVFPRWIAMYRLRHERGLSFPQIGRLLNKDHSTCLYAVERIEALIQSGQFKPSKQAA